MKYGARHLKRAIERNLLHPLSNLIATDQLRRRRPDPSWFRQCRKSVDIPQKRPRTCRPTRSESWRIRLFAPHAGVSPQEPFSRYHEVSTSARPDDNLTSG